MLSFKEFKEEESNCLVTSVQSSQTGVYTVIVYRQVELMLCYISVYSAKSWKIFYTYIDPLQDLFKLSKPGMWSLGFKQTFW
jgi:hypothetical protein